MILKVFTKIFVFITIYMLTFGWAAWFVVLPNIENSYHFLFTLVVFWSIGMKVEKEIKSFIEFNYGE